MTRRCGVHGKKCTCACRNLQIPMLEVLRVIPAKQLRRKRDQVCGICCCGKPTIIGIRSAEEGGSKLVMTLCAVHLAEDLALLGELMKKASS